MRSHKRQNNVEVSVANDCSSLSVKLRMPNLGPFILALITNLGLSLSNHGGCNLKSTLEIPILSRPRGLLYVIK